MKKSILISGIIIINLMLFGALFKVMHWPGAGILLVVSISSFCFYFLPMALLSSYKSQEVKKYKWLYIVTFIVFFIDLMGALFKIQHWPGAGMLLVIGVPIPFVFFLPVYLYQTRKDKKSSLLNFLGIMFGLIFLAVFSALLALNVSYSVLSKFAMSAINSEKNIVFNESAVIANNANSTQINQKSDELYNYIETIKQQITFVDKQMPENAKINISELENIDSYCNFDIIALKDKVKNYQLALLNTNSNENLKKLVSSLFNVDNEIYENFEITWEQKVNSSSKLIQVLDALTQIQNNIRFVEKEFNQSL